MDEDTVPSEDSDSEATVLPAGDIDESPGPEERPVITLHPDYQLDPEFKWICIGKHKETGQMVVRSLPDNTWDPYELLGVSTDATTILTQALRGQ
jgi:hypothetical protein